MKTDKTDTPATADVQPERVSHTLEEWEAEIAAADQRGYLRGRNETIEIKTAEPALYQQPRPVSPSLLGRIRPSVWDL